MTKENLTAIEKECLMLMWNSNVPDGSEAESDLEVLIFHPDTSDTQKISSVVDYLKGYLAGKKEASASSEKVTEHYETNEEYQDAQEKKLLDKEIDLDKPLCTICGWNGEGVHDASMCDPEAEA